VTLMPPETPAAVRLKARLGPEVIASILAVVVVAAVAVVVGIWQSLPQPPAVTAGATPFATASPATSPTLVPTPRANATARILVQVMDQLIAQRAALEAEASRGRPSVQTIAELLRDINASLLLQDAPLTQLAADPGTADLAARIRTTNEATFEVVRRIQQASISNSGVYIAGAAEAVDTLAPLVTLRAELALLAGGPESVPPPTTAQPSRSAP
jgi:hypothetical protein